MAGHKFLVSYSLNSAVPIECVKNIPSFRDFCMYDNNDVLQEKRIILSIIALLCLTFAYGQETPGPTLPTPEPTPVSVSPISTLGLLFFKNSQSDCA
jgi:hypothetical protein